MQSDEIDIGRCVETGLHHSHQQFWRQREGTAFRKGY